MAVTGIKQFPSQLFSSVTDELKKISPISRTASTQKNVAMVAAIILTLTVIVGGIIYYQRRRVWKQVPNAGQARSNLRDFPEVVGNRAVITFKEDNKTIKFKWPVEEYYRCDINVRRQLLVNLIAQRTITYQDAELVITNETFKERIRQTVREKISTAIQVLITDTRDLLKALGENDETIASLSNVGTHLHCKTDIEIYNCYTTIKQFKNQAQALICYQEEGFDKVSIEGTKVIFPSTKDEGKMHQIDLGSSDLVQKIVDLKATHEIVKAGEGDKHQIAFLTTAPAIMDELRAQLGLGPRLLRSVKLGASWIGKAAQGVANYTVSSAKKTVQPYIALAKSPEGRAIGATLIGYQIANWAIQEFGMQMGASLAGMDPDAYGQDLRVLQKVEQYAGKL